MRKKLLKTKPWTLAAPVIMLVMYAVAVSNDVYNLTSPHVFPWHVLLRKTYSVIAFAIIGFVYAKAMKEHGHAVKISHAAFIVGAYSAAIEVGQAFSGSHEGLKWNAVDVFCGAVGGAAGSALEHLIRILPSHEDRS